MKYQLKIILESDICIGNGESKGNAIDREICADKNGVPYIPARRIKGCLRQTARFLCENGYENATEKMITLLFGDHLGNEGNIIIDDAIMPIASAIDSAVESINNSDEEYLKEILHKEHIERIFTAVRGQTGIDKNGVKVDGSLRYTRVLTKNNVVFHDDSPVEFVADIHIVSEDEKIAELLAACCKGTRHIGTSRNRGLGNVSMVLEKCDDEELSFGEEITSVDQDKYYSLEYRIQLDSPVTIVGYKSGTTMIPARNIIGACAGCFSRNKMGLQDEFDDLFLNGEVKWSSLTPVIDNVVSKPTPMCILKLKNGGGKLINQFAQSDNNWKKLKPKTIETTFASKTKSGIAVADIMSITQYHDSIIGHELYMQSAIESGYIMGGNVVFKGKYYNTIREVLKKTSFRFGRSKNIQYANSHLVFIGKPQEIIDTSRSVTNVVYFVLESDLIISKDGLYVTDNESVREYICEQFNLKLEGNQPKSDIIRYDVIGGFNNMWHLQKMQIPVIKAGSIYCFQIAPNNLPKNVRIGAYQQEGFGEIRIYSEDEITKLSNVVKGQVDTHIGIQDENIITRVKVSLTIMMIRETLLRYARNYSNNHKLNNQVPVSRLRLMLQQADSFEDFMKKVDTIKESDVSSENTGRKKAAQELIKEFYGSTDTVDWNKMLADEPGLMKALKVLGQSELDKLWKLPFMLLIHEMHYKKGEK